MVEVFPSATEAVVQFDGSLGHGALLMCCSRYLSFCDVMIVIVMGVSGCGKSTVAEALAHELGWQYVDADDYHPVSNVSKMASGIPLTDEDRLPWILALADRLQAASTHGDNVVLSCSALSRWSRRLLLSRALLCGSNPASPASSTVAAFVHLVGTFELIHERLRARRGHFMPATLLKNQFAALQPPRAVRGSDCKRRLSTLKDATGATCSDSDAQTELGEDDDVALEVDTALPVHEIVSIICHGLGLQA